MVGKFVVFLGLALFAKGAVVPAIPAVPAKLEEFDAVPQYSFAYDVQDTLTGDSKAQYETRNGDIVQGSYSLIEADGTRRIVEYTADPINGFNAVVSREPATAVAAIAAPVVPYTPAIAGAPIPAAPAPAIPESGPDADVEVVEARSGPQVDSSAPRTREEELRQQQERQLQQLQEIQRQQQEQHRQQLQQLQQVQQQQRARQQVQQRQQRPQQQEQQQDQQQAAPVKALASPLPVAAIAKSQRLLGFPAGRAITSYTTYPTGYAYTAAYTSPYAFAAPLGGLAYAPAV